MFFNEDHLKITKVRTLNGNSPLIKDGRVQTKVIYAPNNPMVRKLLEEQNTRLLDGMKMKIEVVKAYSQNTPRLEVDVTETNDLKKQLEELRKQNAELQTQNKELQEVVVMKESVAAAGSNGNGAHPDAKDKLKTSSNEAK